VRFKCFLHAGIEFFFHHARPLNTRGN
jgi:hypothetical protein